MGREEVVGAADVGIYLVERQEGAVVAVSLDCPGHIANRSTVVDLVVPVALRFPLFGSRCECLNCMSSISYLGCSG